MHKQPQSTKNDVPEHSNEICKKKDSSKTSSGKSAKDSLLSKLPDLDSIFHIHEKIGEGTFSNVYLASLKCVTSNRQFAIKHLIPTSHPKRMQYELDCLNRIGGKDNVVSCDMTMRQADCVVFVMPYLKHQKFADYVLEMTVKETKLYMRNLLLALRRVHSFNIIHRDIKPSNFLYNRHTKQFLLVDFGLAQKVNENENSLRNPIMKRKREDDDLENAENPRVKRCALEQVGGNKQDLSGFAKQPQHSNVLSTNTIKRPLTTNSSNVINNTAEKVYGKKQSFQNLMPQKVKSTNAQTSFVRVQNSQVQLSTTFPRPKVSVLSSRQDRCQRQICNICLTRKAQFAPRAGTPGFRPPEVLLKYPLQTTAVDMWSAGVIMLCILSGCYPFFRSPDDISALCEIITVFGKTAITTLAKKIGRNVVCSEKRKPLNLRILCESLRQRKTSGKLPKADQPLCQDCHHSNTLEHGCLCEDKCRLDLSSSYFPRSAFDLLARLLDVDPDTRISAEDALQHPFITET
ncbi:Cell division control protein 7 [Homalodisca vitripennis]|nr:Cell division control protein 7 [Homalodisca vitripennis]